MTQSKESQLRHEHRGSLFADSVRKGFLLAAAFLVLVLPPVISYTPTVALGPGVDAGARVQSSPDTHAESPAVAAAPKAAPRSRSVKLADFHGTRPSIEVHQMADWILSSGDHQRMSFVIVDKKDARVYVFDPRGKLKAAAPALLGQAVGDDTVPGVGDKSLQEVLPEEKTTPAGRFVAEVGQSTRGEDVVWVDYDAAVSMHRVLRVKERLRSLATPTKVDNRMSFGCINLPRDFYEKVLRPTVDADGAVIYVLPETRPLGETFASFYDVTAPVNFAQH